MYKKVYHRRTAHHTAPELRFVNNVAVAKCENCHSLHPLSKLQVCKVFIRFGASLVGGERVLPNRRVVYEPERRVCFRKYAKQWLCEQCVNTAVIARY